MEHAGIPSVAGQHPPEVLEEDQNYPATGQIPRESNLNGRYLVLLGQIHHEKKRKVPFLVTMVTHSQVITEPPRETPSVVRKAQNYPARIHPTHQRRNLNGQW